MENKWKSVCADQWGENEATVVCRQLSYRTDGQLQLYIYTVACPSNVDTIGTEDNVLNKEVSPFPELNKDYIWGKKM